MRALLEVHSIGGIMLATLASSGCYGPDWGLQSAGSSSDTTSGEPGASSSPWPTSGDGETTTPGVGTFTTASTGAGLDTSSGTAELSTGTTDPASDPSDTAAETTAAETTAAETTAAETAAIGTTGEPPAAPLALSLGFSSIKRFDFTWSSVPDAEYYQLWERPDEGADYVQLGDDIYAESLTVTMPLHLRFHASYYLRACSGMVCVDSAPISVLDSMAGAVGYFKASNSAGGDHFGEAVAVSGDGETLAVGASWERSAAVGVQGDQNNEDLYMAGAVYVFRRTGMSWSQEAYVKASNTGPEDQFGAHLALSHDGDTLAVGAYGEASAAKGVGGDQANDAAPKSGAVYVFERAGSTWSQQAYIKASNTTAYHYFGTVALAGDGDTLAVGASGEAGSAGAVHLYTRAGGVWAHQAHLKGANTESGDQFARRVALSADGARLAVGAIAEDGGSPGVNGVPDNSVQNAGAAYVFVRAGDLWSQEAYVKALNPGKNDTFGDSIALSADGATLAVGARGESSASEGVNGPAGDESAPYAGAVYVYTRAGGVWSHEAYVKASNTNASDDFGVSVALSADGDILAVAAMGEAGAATGVGGDEETNDAPDSGAAYVFLRAGGVWSQRSYVKSSNSGSGDGIWMNLAMSADGNTLAWGANYEDSAAKSIGGEQGDNTAKESGAVYLF